MAGAGSAAWCPAGRGGGYSNLYLNSIKIDYFKKLFLIVIKTPQAEPGGLRQQLAAWALSAARCAPRTNGTSRSRGTAWLPKKEEGASRAGRPPPARCGFSRLVRPRVPSAQHAGITATHWQASWGAAIWVPSAPSFLCSQRQPWADPAVSPGAGGAPGRRLCVAWARLLLISVALPQTLLPPRSPWCRDRGNMAVSWGCRGLWSRLEQL